MLTGPLEAAAACFSGAFTIVQLPQILGFVFYAGILSMMGLGLTLTYQVTKVPNFAYASYAGIGMYIAFLGHEKILNIMPPYPLAPLAFALGGAASLLTYLLVIKPLSARGASLVQLMIATIAVDLFLSAVLYTLSDYFYYTRQIYAAKGFLLRSNDYQILTSPPVTAAPVIVSILVVVVAVVLYIFLYRTKLGISMRAAIENPSLSEILGMPTNRIYMLSWFLAGGLGGVAGFFYPLWFQGDPSVSARILVTIFAVSVSGGLGSIYGPFPGALLVSYAESILSSQVYGCASSLGLPWAGDVLRYNIVFPMILLVMFIAFAPTGMVPLISSAVGRIQGWRSRRGAEVG